MDTVFQIILAFIALSFLVFIHELGHYWVALRVGMTVEVFSIGFGKPIYSWMRGKVKWQIGWLPFGGYVKIAGMEIGKDDQANMPGGFFAKKPWDRLQVAIAGPLANLILAFVIFTIIWAFGGRDKLFSEFTDRLGWIDPKSELYQEGVRPGDILKSYNGKTYKEYKELVYAAMFNKDPVALAGLKVNENTFQETPFEYKIKPYQLTGAADGFYTLGILGPASYLIYDHFPDGEKNLLMDGSPMRKSGIQPGDRLVWLAGDPLYSLEQMSSLVNEQKTLLTIQRGNEVFLARVPRTLVGELKLSNATKEEISDWQYLSEAKTKFSSLYFIPYIVSTDLIVESAITFIDPDMQKQLTEKNSSIDQSLQAGDKILAVDTIPVTHGADFLRTLQERFIPIVVQRTSVAKIKPSWTEADADFNQAAFIQRLAKMTSTFGTAQAVEQEGDLLLLQPVVPKKMLEFNLTEEQKSTLDAQLAEQRTRIEEISDPQKRSAAMRNFEDSLNRLMLGISLQDETISYNPTPFTLFKNVVAETWHTLVALVSGELNPKWLSGPVGIVQVIQRGWSVGIKEALFWVAAISINLGVLNLLPIPVLDGGYILLSLFEMITGKKIKPKTLEKLILPFVVILIGFLIFVTYYDIRRLF